MPFNPTFSAMRCFFLTGEPSGDKLAAIIAKQLMDKYSVQVQAWGGHYLRSAGIQLVRDTSDIAVMGYLNVLKKAPAYIRLLGQAKSDIETFQPDVLVLVDYGGLNLKIAKWAKKKGYRVVYYSPPKIWATRGGRLKHLKAYCDEVIVLYPFEQEYYANQGLEVVYHGHPLASSQVAKTKKPLSASDKGTLKIALIPGSREQEVTKILPVMLDAAGELDDYDLLISCAPSISLALLKSLIPQSMMSKVTIRQDELSDFIHFADLAIVASGTVTVEVAMADVPQVVCYKMSEMMYQIAKKMIRVKYISLINLILQEEAVIELIQGQCTGPRIAAELRNLESSSRRTSMLSDYRKIKESICRPNAVELIVQTILGNTP